MGITKEDGRLKGLKVKAFGKIYSSLKSLAIEQEVNISSLRQRMFTLSMTAEDAVTNLREGRRKLSGISVQVNGKAYISVAEAARDLDVPRGRLTLLMRRYEISAAEAYEYYLTSLGEATGTRVRIDGVLYPSKSAAATAAGIQRTTFFNLYAKGLRTSAAMHKSIGTRTLDGEGHVYMISNTVNAKCYIGLTLKGVAKRYAQHIRAAQNGVRGKLYDAMRKYGTDKFSVRTIATCASTKLALKEKSLIAKHDTIRNGYNRFSGGSVGGYRQTGEPVTYRGTEYLDLHHLCYKFGISKYRSTEFAAQGKSIAWIVKEGLRWLSLSDAHRKAEANGTLLRYRGRDYAIKEFAAEFELPLSTTSTRFRKGWTPAEILKAAR